VNFKVKNKKLNNDVRQFLTSIPNKIILFSKTFTLNGTNIGRNVYMVYK